MKAEIDAARQRMRGLGLGDADIAAELSCRYRLRPRKAYRIAYGWSLTEAAARFNARAATEGTDLAGRASMTGAHLCEYEQWPHGGRKPSVYLLLLLAKIYTTDVLSLLDFADHEHLAPADRLILQHTAHPGAHGSPAAARAAFADELSRLLAERGWSLRELARRVPCDAGYLSRLIHGQKKPARTMAARLEELLGGDGRLLAHVPEREISEKPDSIPGTAARDPQQANAAGISVTLPYVPGRLVIEVSGLGAAPATGCEGPGGRALSLVPAGPTIERGQAG